MAKLTNTKYFTLNPDQWGTKSLIKVGHNRHLQVRSKSNGELYLQGLLHGHPIVTIEINPANRSESFITMDPCGYRTTTTRQAMQDFVEGYTGLRCGVSFAKGEFTARILGQDLEENGHGTIETSIAGVR